MMKKFYFLFIFLGLFSQARPQMEINAWNATGGAYSTTFVTDYQCLGINPANLGWRLHKNNKMALGLFELGAGIYSEPLTKDLVMGRMFDEGQKLTMDEKIQAAKDFTDARLWAQGAMTWFGMSYQDDEFGGLAVSIRDRGVWNTLLNEYGARFLFLGYNDFYDNQDPLRYFDSISISGGDTTAYCTDPEMASLVYKGTDAHFTWYREFNVGYGRMLLDVEGFRLYAGVGIKYLVGYGSFRYLQAGDNVDAFSSLSPLFDVEYSTPTPSQVSGSGMKKVGTGFGIDLGLTLTYKDKIKAGLALNDIGSIKWDGNVYEGNNTHVWRIETGGMENYNIFSQGELIVADNAPGDPEKWKGIDSKTTQLPLNMRMGASYRVNEMLEGGFDMFIPLDDNAPGSYEGIMFGFGGHYTPVSWLQLSMGFSAGGKIGTRIPFGVTFYPVKQEDGSNWEVGLALRDLLSLAKEENATVSASIGFLRFNF